MGANVYIIKLGEIVYSNKGSASDNDIKTIHYQESHYFVKGRMRHYVIYAHGYMIKIIIDINNKGWIDIARMIMDKKLY